MQLQQENKKPDNRNIIDWYKYWTTDAIKADLNRKKFSYSVLCLNISGDFNIGTVIRNCNAFCASHVYIAGNKKWDRRGSVGSHNYLNISYIPLDKLDDLIKDFDIVGVDNVPTAENISTFNWPKNPLIVFGEENNGIGDFLKKCQKIIYIEQHGSVRSLNVGSASAIVLNNWCEKNLDGLQKGKRTT